MNRKHIFLLVGQKGSGKSYIGTILDKEFGIKFIRVEDWAKEIKKDRDVGNESYLRQVFDAIENGIRAHLNQTDNLVFESTGLTPYFDDMLESLMRDFKVTTIGVYADSSICLDRVKKRDQTIHISVSDDQVSLINEKVREKKFKADFLIENEHKTEMDIIQELNDIVALSQLPKK